MFTKRRAQAALEKHEEGVAGTGEKQKVNGEKKPGMLFSGAETALNQG